MFFDSKFKKIQELEARIMNTNTMILDILFDKRTSNELAKTMVKLLVCLDRETAEFMLNEYEDLEIGKMSYPKNSNQQKRYNVIGPMLRKHLIQTSSESDYKF